MKLHQIETPALILDKAAFDRNRQAMSALLSGTVMALRPHYKSHRCPAIAKIQLSDGAKGICCAKLGEAEDLAECGVQDILIANQVVQKEKMGRLAALASRCRLTVCVDDAENVIALEKAMAAQGAYLYCLVEYDIGMKRCGVETHEEVIELARLIDAQAHLSFEGVQAYAGHMAHEKNRSVRQAATDAAEKDLRLLRDKLTAAGLPPKEISGGSTGDVDTKPKDSVYTEMQCGSYLFMDCAYGALKLGFEHSLYLLTTVVSTKPDRIVTDGGVKSLGMDQGDPAFVGFEGLKIGMSEEHGQVAAPGHGLRIGDKVRYIPGHCCTTINGHDRIYVIDGEEVADVWQIVSRGKSQ